VSDTHASSEQLSRLIDGDLGLAERAAVLDHINHCPACAAEQARVVEVSAALRGVAAARWSEAQTAALVAHLPPDAARAPRSAGRGLPVRLAALLVATLTLAGAVAFVVSVPVGPLVAGSLWQAFAWLPPIGGTSALGAGAALVAISLLAPLLAYPLARWR
jgi:anti-sigma factor RsiW